MYPFSPKFPSHPGAGRFLITGPSREVLGWRFLSLWNFPWERNDSYSRRIPQTTPTFMLMRWVKWAPLIALGLGLAVLERPTMWWEGCSFESSDSSLTSGRGENSWRLNSVTWSMTQVFIPTEWNPNKNQSILKKSTLNIHWKDWVWSWSSNTLATWQKEPRQTRGWQRIKLLDGITDSMDMSLSKLRETVKDREAWCAQFMGSQRVRHDWATEQQQSKYEIDSWLVCL